MSAAKNLLRTTCPGTYHSDSISAVHRDAAYGIASGTSCATRDAFSTSERASHAVSRSRAVAGRVVALLTLTVRTLGSVT